MKTLRFLRRESLQVILLLLPFVLAAAWWDKIPPVVVTHWNVHGQPNGSMPKDPGLLWVPVLNVVLCLGLAFLPTIAHWPGGDSVRFRRILRVYRYAITTLIAQVAVAMIALAAGWHVDIGLIAVNGLLALIAVVGNYFGSLPPNGLAGCRTPWTSQDPGTWRATHRTLGRLMVFGAVALLGVEFFVSRETEIYLLLAGVVGIGLWSLGYSAWVFQRRRLA